MTKEISIRHIILNRERGKKTSLEKIIMKDSI